MSASRRAIVVIHPGGLGDVLLSIGALAVLRSRFPHHEIILLAGSEVGALLARCGVIDCVWSIESGPLSILFSDGAQLSAGQRGVFSRCDLVVGWLNDHTGALRGTLQELGIPRVILEAPAVVQGHHQSERFIRVLQGECSGDTPLFPCLQLPDQVRQAGADTLRAMRIKGTAPLIMCHPGSGSVHKCVRADTWSLLVRECQGRQWTPVLVLGPADEQTAAAIHQAGVVDIPILRPQSVTLLAAILAQAQGYLGHDSGVTHLAALLGVPTVAMFGPTDEQRWAPLGKSVKVVKGGSCSCMDWDAVRVCGEKPCLNVKPEAVFEALDAVIAATIG
jgi:heptosyltransferase III